MVLNRGTPRYFSKIRNKKLARLSDNIRCKMTFTQISSTHNRRPVPNSRRAQQFCWRLERSNCEINSLAIGGGESDVNIVRRSTVGVVELEDRTEVKEEREVSSSGEPSL